MSIERSAIIKIVFDILKHTPNKPFQCLSMSALFHAALKANLGLDPNLVTGDLLYNGSFIFKQDYSITREDIAISQEWTGHAWIEIDNLICDISILKTLYSKEFTKPFKEELMKKLGEGKGCLLATKVEAKDIGLQYNALDCIEDQTTTQIIRRFMYQLPNR